jgi:hypothetical protein
MKNKSEKNILKTLLNNSNDNICRLSLRQISCLSGVPFCTVRRAIKRLLNKGLIAQIKRANRSASVYIINCTSLIKVSTPDNIINNKVSTPVLNLTPKVSTPRINLYKPKNTQITEYTEMPKEEAEIRNICNYLYSMLDNNEVYPTGIVFNILSYFLVIILNLITEGLKRSACEKHIFCDQKIDSTDKLIDSATFIQIPLKNNSAFDVQENVIEEYQKAYPFVDVKEELRKIYIWNYSNPSKRKTARGILRHINTWLNKENQKQKSVTNVNERGVPILKHLTKESLVTVPYDYFDDLND